MLGLSVESHKSVSYLQIYMNDCSIIYYFRIGLWNSLYWTGTLNLIAFRRLHANIYPMSTEYTFGLLLLSVTTGLNNLVLRVLGISEG